MENTNSWFKDKILLGMTPKEYLKSNLTLPNLIAALILCVSVPIMVYRVIYGLGPSTNLSDNYPWGLWIGFDILVGIALAAPGLTLGTAVHLFGMEKYHPFVRPAILSSLLGYIFAVIALMFDLGRYYRIPYLLVWSWGFTSILFLIGWHFFLYINISIVEFSPVLFEWLDLKKWKDFFSKLTVWATIFGVIIAAGHQSALGALYLAARAKLYPLWYSPLLPIFFLLSAIFAGISMVIVESTLSHRFFPNQVKDFDHAQFDQLSIGLGKAASSALFIYFLLKVFDLVRTENWVYLNTAYGYLYLVEVLGFVLVPAMIFLYAVRQQNAKLTRFAGLLTVLGVVLNRLDVSIVAFNWYLPASQKYYPRWTEIMLTLGVITMLVLSYRFIVNRMAILHAHEESEPESMPMAGKKQAVNF
ncbi:MAG: polysulfide reductase NrfD [Deltaproteobacteria bacterium]|nr:polysulfide reductase NrfD [Deltaproteobacteria bacterium]